MDQFPLIPFFATLIPAVALLDWVAVARKWRKVELFAKPATMLLLLTCLALVGGFHPLPLLFFCLGLFFSLLGDVFLLLSDHWFIPGLATFLLVHLAYITGFNIPLGMASSLGVTTIGILLAIAAGKLLQRIMNALYEKGLKQLRRPVAVYGIVMTITLLSAIQTGFRPDWKSPSVLLVSLGAFLFWTSDLILAWNRFVKSIHHGRLINMIAYHLGQMTLVAGILLQFSKQT